MNTSVQGTLHGANPAALAQQEAYRLALKHSAHVRRLKLLLPLSALLISLAFIGVSVVRTWLPENLTIESARIEDGKVVMERPEIAGRNEKGASYSMNANRALQDIKNPNLITLQDVTAALPMSDDVMAKVTASTGLFDRTADNLNMTEPFDVKLSNGLTAHFQTAHLDIASGSMTTDKPVTILTKEASIIAQTMKITDKGKTITFAGQVRLDVAPSAIRNEGNTEPGQP
jgi:lipopolysaccharide export system protein LptC